MMTVSVTCEVCQSDTREAHKYWQLVKYLDDLWQYLLGVKFLKPVLHEKHANQITWNWKVRVRVTSQQSEWSWNRQCPTEITKFPSPSFHVILPNAILSLVQFWFSFVWYSLLCISIETNNGKSKLSQGKIELQYARPNWIKKIQ